ncbi:MAG: GNAT family N-acetyltransferase [Alphaproteobacteria bacterium]|nr:GNAT family N-acetyltransferase [Alphaproteobacteria bacterium]MCL2505164.1 GNAT family N-acetyltransferase [Alphaproteobacteria bacterium]
MLFSIKKLSVDDGIDVFNMLQQIPNGENGFMNDVEGLSFDEYKNWLTENDMCSRQVGIKDGWKVPQTIFWLMVDGNPIGMGKLRHFLTDRLLEEGGTIGYAIIPSERSKGYGKVFVRELLKEAQKLSIGKVLFTISNHNIASVKIALANGGVLEKTTDAKHYIWAESLSA